MKIKLIAADSRNQIAFDSHDFERREDLRSKGYQDVNYHKCKNCGYIVFNVCSNKFNASKDYNQFRFKTKTCNEILMAAVLE